MNTSSTLVQFHLYFLYFKKCETSISSYRYISMQSIRLFSLIKFFKMIKISIFFLSLLSWSVSFLPLPFVFLSLLLFPFYPFLLLSFLLSFLHLFSSSSFSHHDGVFLCGPSALPHFSLLAAVYPFICGIYQFFPPWNRIFVIHPFNFFPKPHKISCFQQN